MPIKAVVETTEGLPDSIKPFYRAGDTDATKGKFVLDVEATDGFALDHIEGLRNAFATAKADLKKTEEALDVYKGLPAASTVREKLRRLDKLQAIDPSSETAKIAQARVDAALSEANAAHESELGKAKDEGERLWGALNDTLLTSAAKAAIAAEGGEPTLLMPHVRSRLTVDRDTLAVSVLREDGTPFYSNAGQPATVGDLVADLKKHSDFGRAFEATASGSGASGMKTPGAQAGANPWIKGPHFNLTEQMRITKADPGRAAQLKHSASTGSAHQRSSFNLTHALQNAKGDPAKLAELKSRIGR